MKEQKPRHLGAKLRSFFWPIYGKENKKFIPMTLMISCILFNFTVLRNLKDTLVLKATGDATILSALKGFVVLPCAILFFIIFAKLSNKFSRQGMFYGTVIFFLIYFALFALALYPMHDFLQPDASAAWLQIHLPDALYDIVNVYRYWVFSLFYVLSELWGSGVSALLFWQFANSIVEVNEAKRFYAHFYLLANLAVAYSGQVSKYFSNLTKTMTDQALAFGITINYLMAIVVGLGVITLFLYWYMNKVILPDPDLVNPAEIKSGKKSLKMGLWDSCKFILNSKYLLLIATLLICYGVSINLVEVTYKYQANKLFTLPGDLSAFMGNVTTAISLSTFGVILIGGALARWLGWRFAALVTPVFIGITGAIFYYCILFPSVAEHFVSYLDVTLLYFIVLVGAIQSVLSKSTKYALFDPTKEMSYIPLDEESKMKGKAAVDVVGGRLGKAGGAYIQQILFALPMISHSVLNAAPYFAAIMIAMVILWIFAVFALSKRFHAMQRHPAWEEKTQPIKEN